MNIVAIIQARCNSARLKNKVLADIAGKPLIERVLDRVRQVKALDNIVVATTISQSDDVLVDWCKSKRVEFFRGSESNVLMRYYECAKFYNADIIVRITADDPFKDPAVIDNAINLLVENKYDYVSNTIKPTFPEGIDIEVFRFESLKIAHEKATLDSEKEHVTPYIWKNKEEFLLFNIEYKEDLSGLRWTVDYIEDLEFARAVYEKIGNKKKHFSMEDILRVLKKYPEIDNTLRNIIRNEGYMLSIEED